MNKNSQAALTQLWFEQALANKPLCEKLKNIKLLIADVDGCLTHAKILVTDKGDEGKEFSIQDGYAIHNALRLGLQIAFLTGRDSASTKARAQRLGILPELCVMGIVEEKKEAVIKMQKSLNVTPEQTLFFGDDSQDYKVRSEVALFAAPENAIFYVYSAADIQLPLKGGHGALRLLLDLILYLQNKHFAQELLTACLATK